jgi:aerobic-type carbon monoxide dehydrogenase small subunit (CoxS/CutS family)
MLTLDVNGKAETGPDTPLLYTLRGDLALRGPRFGCGLAQCGYCLNGMIMAATALLAARPEPSDAEIREALAGHLCRCGTHLRIIRAVKRAARALRRIG